MPSRLTKKEAKRRAKYLQVRYDVLESARACYKAEPEEERTAERERYQAEPEKKRSAKRQRVLNLFAWRREFDAGRLNIPPTRPSKVYYQIKSRKGMSSTHSGAHVATYSYYKC